KTYGKCPESLRVLALYRAAPLVNTGHLLPGYSWQREVRLPQRSAQAVACRSGRSFERRIPETGKCRVRLLSNWLRPLSKRSKRKKCVSAMSSKKSHTRWESNRAPAAKSGPPRLTVGCVSPDNDWIKESNPRGGELLWNKQNQTKYRKPFPPVQISSPGPLPC